jgi:hypothetical protein
MNENYVGYGGNMGGYPGVMVNLGSYLGNNKITVGTVGTYKFTGNDFYLGSTQWSLRYKCQTNGAMLYDYQMGCKLGSTSTSWIYFGETWPTGQRCCNGLYADSSTTQCSWAY